MGIMKKALLSILLVVLPIVPAGAGSPSDDLGGTAEAGRVVLNELLASNVDYFPDAQGEYDDWIELYNPGDVAVDVGGMHLTDNLSDLTKWRIPVAKTALTTIAPHGHLLIWADKDVAQEGLHAGFSLDASGEELALVDADGVTVLDSITFGEQRADVSYGRVPDGTDAWQLMAFPTPGGSNVQMYAGFVDEPQITPGHGFYSSPVQVAIASSTPDAVIYYTTDGSDPYLVDSTRPSSTATVYSGPLQVSKTTCLRAAAVRPGWRASTIETQTYLFVSDIIRQSPNGASPGSPWPSGSVNGQLIDYGMDPDVVNDPRYRDLMDDAMVSIPSISLVTNLANLFDPSRGIYVNAGQEGRDWERPVSVELVNPDGSEGFQIDAGIRIRGGFSRMSGNPKHSFRLFFRSAYGSSSLKYPLFDSEGAEEFEHVDLRTAQNYAWSVDTFNDGAKNTFVREEFCRDLQRETGQPYTRTRYYHLYINGQYWGLYETQERSEASYAATYFGGEEEEYDVITPNFATDGTIDEWYLLWSLCQQGFATDQQYYAVQGRNPDGTDNPALPVRVDIDNLIDYMLGIFFTGNDDAPVGLGGGSANNFFAIRNRTISSRQGWIFFAYDNEHSLGTYRDVFDDRTAPVSAGQSRSAFNPQWLHQKLMVHPEYCLEFADHVHKHFFNAGVMTPEKAIALCLSRANQIDLAIIAESARWGDQRPSRANNPYTKEDWWAEVNGYLIETYFPIRTQIVLNQLRNRGLYPNVDAPVFSVNGSYRHGGYVSSMAALSMAGGGAVWYTLDGSDPRIPGVAASAGNEIVLVPESAPKRAFVPAGAIDDAWRSNPAFNDSAWAAGAGGVGYERGTGYESYFAIDVEAGMYGRNTTCYVRIPFALTSEQRAGLSSLAIRTRCDDAFVAYLNGVEVARTRFTGEPSWNSAAGEQVSDDQSIALAETNISAHLGVLRTGVNLLAIQAMNINTTSTDFLISVELVSGGATGKSAPAGVSPTALLYTEPISLEHSARVKARALSGAAWSALNEAVFAVGPVAHSLRISEIMYHPQDTGQPSDSNAEYIELTHVGAESIRLDLVRFSDGVDFTFGDVELSPGGCVLVVKDLAAFEARYGSDLPVAGEYSGSLSNAGERIELQDALGVTIQAVSYEDGWYPATDGTGYSLTARNPQTMDPSDESDETAWRPSAEPGGSPGRLD
ncbi:MAG TPA: lamin tail domain-containing protein [Sedimentisphaerales bacterium]|jgi:hypothetical protein|nr:lamin tail domain-containing protein [Sedimentisphaerales bacterium]HNU30526.1 lamin tail domain-containing protein [Sedimentisphaerales bacterium]